MSRDSHGPDPGTSDAATYCYSYPRPAVTADVVLFTIREGALALLLIRRGRAPFAGHWALPGGFVDIDEDLADGAARELAEETGIGGVALEQVQTFGRVGRDPRGRVISIAHWALAPYAELRPAAGDDAAAVRWFPVADLPPLAFDHDEIIAVAHARLRRRLSEVPLAVRLLPSRFTLTELQAVHETLLDAEIDGRNLATWATALSGVEATGERRDRPGRPSARLYRARRAPPGAYL
jgi:8-oxo-dGTP diphosphatase